MGLTTAFSASGVIKLSSDRDAGREEESGRERCTEREGKKKNEDRENIEAMSSVSGDNICCRAAQTHLKNMFIVTEFNYK